MNKKELAMEVAKLTDLDHANAYSATSAVITAIQNELVDGGTVGIAGFGTFSTSIRTARTGRNPQTGEALAIPARNAVKFKVGKALKESVQ